MLPDAILYLNLDRRPDRRVAVETEIEAYLDACRVLGLPVPPVERLASSLGGPTGPLGGCIRTHARAADRILAAGWDSALILEDDFVWEIDPTIALPRLQAFAHTHGSTFGFCQIAHHPAGIYAMDPVVNGVALVHKAIDAAGYWLTRRAAERLSPLWHKGADAFWIDAEWWHHSNDIVWDGLRAEMPCYALFPRMGRQAAGKSDLQGKDVDYG